MNPYKVLGVSPGDSQETIKKAYRKAAKECHPDTHPDHKSEERFKELGEAYRILSDEGKRKEYDRKIAGQQDRDPNLQKAYGSKARSRPISTEELQRGFEKFFSVQNKGGQSEKKRNPQKNSMDVSGIFERYMGLKK